MGQIRLNAPSRKRLPPQVEDRVLMSGMEGIPWRSRAWWEGDQLLIERAVNESGTITIPWLHGNGREELLATSTLREQPEPYLLELELARGVLNRLRNQLASWEIPLTNTLAEFAGPWRKSVEAFIAAATTHRDDPAAAAESAATAISLALQAQQAIVTLYGQKSLEARRQANRRLNTLFSCQVDAGGSHAAASKAFLETFNAVSLSCSWKQVEPNDSQWDWSQVDSLVTWCQANRVRMCMGPLVTLDKQHLPDWLYLWDDDFDALDSYVGNYVSNVVSRYKGQLHVWEVAGRVNLSGALDLSENQQLQLIVTAIQATRQNDPQVPLVVGFGQPWAEYLARDKWEISPLHVADALLRAEIGVAGFTLEINLGYDAPGSGCHGLLDLSQLIDRWSQLGAPLLIRLAVPSEAGEHVVPGFQASAERQQTWLKEVISLLLCKPAVHGIIYQQWNDTAGSEFPFAGLVSQTGAAKPALAVMTGLRQAYMH